MPGSKSMTAAKLGEWIAKQASSITHGVLVTAYTEATKGGVSVNEEIRNNMLDDDTIKAGRAAAKEEDSVYIESLLLEWVTAHAEEEDARLKAKAELAPCLSTPYLGVTDVDRPAQDYDLLQFKNSIDELFDWYPKDDSEDAYRNAGFQKFHAPCRSIIQSSGTGKTKLMYDFKQKYGQNGTRDYTVIMFTCGKAHVSRRGDDSIFDVKLEREDFRNMDRSLNKYIEANFKDPSPLFWGSTKTPKDKVVLMFDEAQHLVETSAGLTTTDRLTAYDSLQRYVQWVRRHMDIVAVCAGTSMSLASCYPYKDERRSSRESPHARYRSGTSLYSPFFRLHTTKCLQHRIAFGSKNGSDGDTFDTDQWTELEMAIPYGRPLFARALVHVPLGQSQSHGQEDSQGQGQVRAPVQPVLEATHNLGKDSVLTVLERLLLGESGSSTPTIPMYASVWSSRIQLENMHSTLADNLLRDGYIHLTSFFYDGMNPTSYQPYSTADLVGPSATFASCCEPLCAYLAMQLMMNESSELKLQHRVTANLSKEKWVEGLAGLFSNRLCSPDRGDFGEILSAVYLLFCADELRAPQQLSDAEKVRRDIHPLCKAFNDKNFGQISVPLAGFEAKILNCSSPQGPSTSAPNASHAERLEVSMMQFCRLEFNLTIKELSHQAFLKQMYESGCAHFLRNAYPLIDAVAAIRHTNNGTDTDTVTGATIDMASYYIPMLISVKTRAGFSKASAANEIDSIVASLHGQKINKACILIVVLDYRSKDEIAADNASDKALEDFFTTLLVAWDAGFGEDDDDDDDDDCLNEVERVVAAFKALNSPASQEALLLATALTWINLQTPSTEEVTDALNEWAARNAAPKAAASPTVAGGTDAEPQLDDATTSWHDVCAQLAACHHGSYKDNNDCDVDTDDVVKAYVDYAKAKAIKDMEEGKTAGDAVEVDDLRAEFTAALSTHEVGDHTSGPCKELFRSWQLSERIAASAKQAKHGIKSNAPRGQPKEEEGTQKGAKKPKKGEEWQRLAAVSISTPIDDCKNTIVSRIVYIPSDDAYGISELVKKETCLSQATKIYSSHGQLGTSLAAAALKTAKNEVTTTGKRSYNDLIVGRLDNTTKTYLNTISKQALLLSGDGEDENDGDDDEEDK